MGNTWMARASRRKKERPSQAGAGRERKPGIRSRRVVYGKCKKWDTLGPGHYLWERGGGVCRIGEGGHKKV